MYNEKKNESGITDIAKKLFQTGVGAFFVTEESLRSILTEKRLPKDLINYFTAQAKEGKDELFRKMGEEVAKTFSKRDWGKEISNILSNFTLEIKAEVNFKPKNEGRQKARER